MSLRHKLASDGVLTESIESVVNGLCLNEKVMGDWNDCSVVVSKDKKYPSCGQGLLVNPYPRPKKKKKAGAFVP